MTTPKINRRCCPLLKLRQWKSGSTWENHDILEIHPSSLTVGHQGHAPGAISADTRLYIVSASANSIRHCQPCMKALTDAFLMPSLWWTDCLRKSNGYFGCEATRSEEGTNGLNMWALFQTKDMVNERNYHWSKFNIFARWIAASNQTGILVFDLDTRTPDPFATMIPEGRLLRDPFWLFTHVLETFCDLEEKSVWAIRDQIRSIETDPDGNPVVKGERKKEANYRLLYNIARHSYHVSETLDVALQTIQHITESHQTYLNPANPSLFSFRPGTQKTTDLLWNEIQSRLLFFQSFLASLRHRSLANEKRLQNEIQLTFQKVTRHDALVMMDDSAALKTLAFVTFTFLPPTFICAIFSTTFFNFDPNLGWRMSDKFWIYWAVAVPTTIISAAVWFFWQRKPPSDRGFENRVEAFSRGLDNMRNV